MATIEEAIRRLKYLYEVHGADQVAAAQAAITTSSQKTEQASLSLEKSFNSLERRYVSTVRAQQDYQRVQERVNDAVRQNPALQERANVVLAHAAENYNRVAAAARGAATAQGAFAQAAQSVQGSVQGMASSLGTLGIMLSRFGPAGVAIAAGLYVANRAIGGLVQSVNDLADRSGKMVDFAETTGISTTALTGLIKAGAEVGVSSEKITTGIERFTVQLDEARRSTGQLHETLERIDPALAKQMVTARDTAEAWDILAEAYRKADMSQRNVLARAAFGRTGIGMGRLLNVSAETGGIAALTESMARLNIVTDQERKNLDQIKDRIDFLEKTSKDLFAAFFAPEVLRAQELYYTSLVAIANQLREIQRLRETAPGMGSQWTLGRLRPGELEGTPAPAAPAAPAAPGMSVEAQNALAAAADKVVQSVLPEIEATKKLQTAIDALTAASDANVQSRMKQADVSGRVLEALLNEQRGLQALQQQYPNLSLAVAQRVQALQMQAQAAAAVTVAEKEAVADEQLRIQLSQQRLTLAEQEAILDAARIARAAQLNATIQAAALQSAQSLQFSNAALQQEIALLNKSGIEANRLKAEWEALAPIRQAAIAAGKSEAEINAILAEQRGLLGELIEQNAQLATARDLAAESEKDIAKGQQEAIDNEMKRKQELADWEAEEQRKSQERAREAEQAKQRAHQAQMQRIEQERQAAEQAAEAYWRAWEAAANRARKNTGIGFGQHERPSTTVTAPWFQEALAQRIASGELVWDEAKAIAAGGAHTIEGILAGWVKSDKAIQAEYDTLGRHYEELIQGPGGVTGALNELISGIGTGDEKAQELRMATINRLLDLLPEEGQISQIEKLLAKMRQQPISLAREELIKSLTDKIESLKDSTDSLNDTMGQVLSPYYSQDPRTTKLGFRAGSVGNADWLTGATNQTALDTLLGKGATAPGGITMPGISPGATPGGTGGTGWPGGIVTPGITPTGTGGPNPTWGQPITGTVVPPPGVNYLGGTYGAPAAGVNTRAPVVHNDNRIIIQGSVDQNTLSKLKVSQYQQTQRIRSTISAA